MNFKFNYDQFLKSYYNCGMRVNDEDENQVGFFRVQLFKDTNTLEVSFLADTGDRADDSWKSKKAFRVSHDLSPGSILLRESFENRVKAMVGELKRIIK